VIAFLAHRPEEPSAPASGELARQMIEETLYCFACHRRDGTGGEGLARTLLPYLGTDPQAKAVAMTPPDLSGVGARLVRPWILDVLAGKAESNRPWLTVPMPNFGLSEAERSRIADRLAVADEIPNLGAPQAGTAPEESSATASALIGQRGFNCVNCHFLGKADYGPDKTAPDFTMAPRRVSRGWFHRWVSNPGRIMPGTPMPSFTKPVDALADGDMSRQKEIIWRFLNHVSVAEEETPSSAGRTSDDPSGASSKPTHSGPPSP
jgi:mono/diheme cytochrome c family protein